MDHAVVVDGGLGYANEERLIGDDRSGALLTAGGLYTLKISDTSELSEDGHLAFSLNEGSDWRYANIVSLTAKITTILSLKVSNTVRYLNLPVPGFKSTDAITSVALGELLPELFANPRMLPLQPHDRGLNRRRQPIRLTVRAMASNAPSWWGQSVTHPLGIRCYLTLRKDICDVAAPASL